MGKKGLFLAVCFVFLLTGCGKKKDIITDCAYSEYTYDLKYDYFDSEATYQFNLTEQEELFMQVECNEGSLDVKVVDLDNEEVYHEELLVTKDWTVPIETAGRYILIFTGHETAGGVYAEVRNKAM